MISFFGMCRAARLMLVVSVLPCFAQTDHAYKYFRVGSATDATHASPRAGYALMGGGADLDEAFQWLCDRAGGGDLLVLRATGTDAYNPYIQKLCPKLNSVATLIIPNREAAADPFVAQTIRQASALFLSGGDQANYINFWMGTPVQSALNDAIARAIPLGGTSAGLAVMGEWAYSAQGDKPDDADLSSALAISDPFGPRVTLVHGFLDISILRGVITDTHFAKRDRMGRLLVFLARLNEQEGKQASSSSIGVHGIGIEERAVVLLDPDGTAHVVGHGSAYFIDAHDGRGSVSPGKPLNFGPYNVQKVISGHAFSVRSWTGDATRYTLSISAGTIRSAQPGNSEY